LDDQHTHSHQLRILHAIYRPQGLSEIEHHDYEHPHVQSESIVIQVLRSDKWTTRRAWVSMQTL
jgi:hypothetical protein